jgi:hypothetical protein
MTIRFGAQSLPNKGNNRENRNRDVKRHWRSPNCLDDLYLATEAMFTKSRLNEPILSQNESAAFRKWSGLISDSAVVDKQKDFTLSGSKTVLNSEEWRDLDSKSRIVPN